ncbi:MAG: hypothetical protein ABSE56_02085 [Bryobacteraceae bacterium]|jgi:hypothetical protein
MKLTTLLLTLLLAVPLLAENVGGKWTASVEGPNGDKMDIAYNFKVDGAKLTGTVTDPMGEGAISDGKVDGDAISFVVVRDFGGNEMKILHKGKVSGDEMKLTVEFGDQTIEINAKRSKS